MAKGVFITKPDSPYDDLPEERYHFPQTYLGAVRQMVGDMVVYYAPRRTAGQAAGGLQAYFAVARVTEIERDPGRPDHYYARLAEYIEFDQVVPFRVAGGTFERALTKHDGSTNKGLFGRAVRVIADDEFDAILAAGFERVDLLPRLERLSLPRPPAGMHEMPPDYDAGPLPRRMVEEIVRRPFREEAFARHVKGAYDQTCALTGLKIINGGGRSEAQAAHIRPVAASGPDSVRNGLALCGTVHWMFDRGLLTLADDYRILAVNDALPDTAKRLLRPDGRACVPEQPYLRPHPRFLEYHRRHVFKG